MPTPTYAPPDSRLLYDNASDPALERAMYMVYWTTVEDGVGTPHAKDFGSADMLAAMAFMEALRKRQRGGEGVRFITMSSEHPDSVGHPGVDVTGPDYNWKKRRR